MKAITTTRISEAGCSAPMQDSTLEGLDVTGGSRARRLGSDLALAVILLVVVAGVSSWLGVHTSTTETEGSGYSLRLEYPRTARAGLDVDWKLTVSHPGGFDKTLTLRLSADQFDIYEHQAFYPSPDTETRDGTDLILTFVAPPGNTFVLGFDAYVQPSSQLGRDSTISVMDAGEVAATLHYSTWLAP
jgi:hypothetical protein